MTRLLFIYLFAFFLLSGCATPKQASTASQSAQSNIENISQLKRWNIRGKIAFIQGRERESANLYWQVNEAELTQSLSLTTYLGINVLRLEQTPKQSHIEVDGKIYKGRELSKLIYQLTGLTLPTEALHYWVKGSGYLPDDIITYNEQLLPTMITSHFNDRNWLIRYGKFQAAGKLMLPKNITITQNDLTIKLIIHQWDY